MYLARIRKTGCVRYLLRESFRKNGLFLHRDLFDLGLDPTDFIVYPGGNSFYFEPGLVSELEDRGVADVDRKLELIFLPFLESDIRRIVVQMTRLGRRKKKDYSREAMEQAQARLHMFDRRRYYFLRYGRLETEKAMARPRRFLNVLNEMSRDEMEYYFQGMEIELKPRDYKRYVYMALGMSESFSGRASRHFPEGLGRDELDQAFVRRLCELNGDTAFIDQPRGCLSEYLVHYAVMWFDFEFGQAPGPHGPVDEFIRRHRAYRPPPPPTDMALEKACQVFQVTLTQWREMDRDGIVRAYRRLALRCHPDQGGDPESFVELNEAYNRLLIGK